MESQETRTPLIIWADDNISRKANLIDFAKGLGVNIHAFTSTADAKAWMDQNIGTLIFKSWLDLCVNVLQHF
jgi:hypothetical protein